MVFVERYRNWTISYRAAPIPIRDCDWSFSHDDYDGAPDSGDVRCGVAASLEAAMRRIDELEEEYS